MTQVIAESMDGTPPTLERTAHALGMSPRTLRRRLADEGTTFSNLLAEVRRDLAQRYLGDRALSIAEVAFILGFSEASAFHRAFRRWTNTTPRQFRLSALAARE